MLINIVETLNIKALDDAIFEVRQKQHIKYLIMNSDTFAGLDKMNPTAIYYESKESCNTSLLYTTRTYKGHAIAICEDLNYGEVDIIY